MFIALVVFVPLVYVVAGFSAVQRGVFASTAAAREAGRAMGTAPDPVTGQERALRAAQLAVEDQSVEATDVRLAYAPAGADCSAAGQLHADADAGGGVLGLRHRDRPDPAAAGVHRRRTPRPASSSSSATATSTAEDQRPSTTKGTSTTRLCGSWAVIGAAVRPG